MQREHLENHSEVLLVQEAVGSLLVVPVQAGSCPVT